MLSYTRVKIAVKTKQLHKNGIKRWVSCEPGFYFVIRWNTSFGVSFVKITIHLKRNDFLQNGLGKPFFMLHALRCFKMVKK